MNKISHRPRINILIVLLSVMTMPLSAQRKNGEHLKIILPERENSFCLSAGMGVSLVAAPSVVDYLNSYTGGGLKVDDFGTGIMFFGASDIPLTPLWSVRAEYTYLFKSYTMDPIAGGPSNLFYSVHAPSLLAQYVIPGKGYFLRFSGGGGYHFGFLNEKKVSPAFSDRWYRVSGIGFKFEATGQTAFDDNLYGSIAAMLQWELLGSLKNGSGIIPKYQGNEVSLSLFAVGLNFGLSYYF
jgi:hypothetical protein